MALYSGFNQGGFPTWNGGMPTAFSQLGLDPASAVIFAQNMRNQQPKPGFDLGTASKQIPEGVMMPSPQYMVPSQLDPAFTVPRAMPSQSDWWNMLMQYLQRPGGGAFIGY